MFTVERQGADQSGSDVANLDMEGLVDTPGDSADELPEESYAAAEPDWHEQEARNATDLSSAMPYLAALLVAAWTAFYIFAHFEQMSVTHIAANSAMWTSWIANWAMPVILVIGLWLLAMRTSTRETGRFVDAANMLSHESRLLEERLAIVNRELSLARDFIASQSRDLESLGRMAAERISGNAETLQSLVIDNNERIRLIGQVSETAVANLEKLRGDLPVLANAARDMTNQIGNAGNVAQDRLESLVEGFDRLDQYGETGEKHVEKITSLISGNVDAFERQAGEFGDGAQQRLTALLAEHEAERTRLAELDATADGLLRRRAEELADHLKQRDAAVDSFEEKRSGAMRERMQLLAAEQDGLLGKLEETRSILASLWEQTVTRLEGRLGEAIGTVSDIDSKALESAQARLLALTDEAARVDMAIKESAQAFDTDLERRRSMTFRRQAEALAAMEERVAAVDERVTEREELHLAHISGLAERGDALAQRIAALGVNMQGLGTQVGEFDQKLGEKADMVAAKLAQSRAVLEENGAMVARLTEDSVRVLELIRSGAEHSDGPLSDAITKAQTRLTAFHESGLAVSQIMADAEGRGAKLSEHLEQARASGGVSMELFAKLQEQLDEVAARSQALAGDTCTELKDAIETLTASSSNALEDVRVRQADAIREIANAIAEQSNTAIAAAVTAQATRVIAQLEESAERATEKGRETTAQLRDQLARVNELTSNLEQRISTAREKAEQRTDSDFTRRMALITEALNSSSIDIAKTFETEVGDNEWATYLRGDRGIFTRRAVRLLDKQEARAVHEVYSADGDFRQVVNRYIADFEGMLRTILSTRDGNALAVTLLSSDIGKLYVALAQAIERLRE